MVLWNGKDKILNRFNFFVNLKNVFILVFLVCCGILCLYARPCFSAIYYVDASNGVDTNDGLQKSSAWKTLKKVEKQKTPKILREGRINFMELWAKLC